MLNDTTWARGPNYLAQAGSTVDVYPHFQVTSGVVGIYKEKFSSKYLAEKRDIWAYLPPTYLENTEARFPVLYMHDGQNLFDKALAFGGNEWKVDEAMDTAAESGEAREAVVIGVGNTSARIYEYTPTPDPEYTPSGGGDNYLMLLMEELKPLVDAELRTLPDPSNTALIGSSLGGLISSYGGVHHPEVFGLIGALSPSVWWDGKMLLGQVASIQGKELRALRVYVDSGDAGPSQDGLANTKLLADQYREVGYQDGVNFLYIVQAGATHSEVFWAQRFPTAAAFLLGPRPNSGSQPF
ncbi:MAG: alpha/beta hydrolase-fold protein [Polyangiaceae bacterium]|nr:alpha/beta hydrolase-fold protein [Polyangiaceae bacterium]